MSDGPSSKELERLERRLDSLSSQLDNYMLTKVHDAELRAIKASIETVLEKVAAAVARVSRIEDNDTQKARGNRAAYAAAAVAILTSVATVVVTQLLQGG